MVPTASQAASLHHAAEIHRAICSTDELEILIAQQDHRTRHPTTATGGSGEQTEGCTRRPRPICGGATGILAPDEPISQPQSCCPTSSHVQWDVYWTSAGCSSPVPYSTTDLWSPDEPHAWSNAANSIRAISKSVRSSYDTGGSSACIHHGSAGRWYPTHHPTSGKPS